MDDKVIPGKLAEFFSCCYNATYSLVARSIKFHRRKRLVENSGGTPVIISAGTKGRA